MGRGIGRGVRKLQRPGLAVAHGPHHFCPGSARQLEAQAENDPVLAKILENAQGDSDEIKRQLRSSGMPSISPASTLNDILERRRAGETRPIDIQ